MLRTAGADWRDPAAQLLVLTRTHADGRGSWRAMHDFYVKHRLLLRPCDCSNSSAISLSGAAISLKATRMAVFNAHALTEREQLELRRLGGKCAAVRMFAANRTCKRSCKWSQCHDYRLRRLQ
jgi:hypothetical protein